MLLLMALGLSALPKLQRDTFPLTPPSEVEARFAYPGATAAEVEQSLCLRVESALDGLDDLIEQRCDARDNLAIVTAQLREGGDMARFYADFKQALEGISQLPERVEPPRFEILQRLATIAAVMVTAESLEARQLLEYAEQLQNRLQQDPRIARVDLHGFSEQNLVIRLPQAVLQRYGLTLGEIRAAIEAESVDLPSGTLSSDTGDLSIRFEGERRTPEQFRQLPIASRGGGAPLLLGEISEIGYEFARPEEKILFNGQRAAQLEISKGLHQDSLRVMAALQEQLSKLQQQATAGVTLQISQDVTANIRDRLRILIDNGLQGLLLVLLTLWAFFGLRYSFWVAMGLPVSFLGALFFMQLLGYSLNMMTLVALLVAIGLLMDDAIVIADNIARQLERGKGGLHAAIDGSREVMSGVISSFLTTAMVVGPIAFLGGKMGEVLKYIPAVLLITLAVSLIEAFLILPAHLRHALDHPDAQRQSAWVVRFNRSFDALRQRLFMPLLRRALGNPYLSVGTLIALVLLSFAMISGGQLKYRALPVLESDTIQARLLLAQGTPLSLTEERVEQLVESLKVTNASLSAREAGRPLVQNISVFFNRNIDANESGSHLATVSADLLHAEERHSSIEEILALWRQEFGQPPDLITAKFTDTERRVAGKAIDIRLQGKQLKQLKQASLELQQWLSRFEGVVDLSDDLRPGKPEYRVSLKPRAASLGITAREVANELRSAIYGNSALAIQDGEQRYEVIVKQRETDLTSLDALYSLTLRSRSGERVALSAVAEIEAVRDYARRHRVNGLATVTIQGALQGKANAKEIMGMTKKLFLPELKEKYPNIKIGFVGQGKESADTGSSLLNNLAIGLLGLFIILSFQFRNYLYPFTVLLAIPLGLIGVVWGHLLMGLELSMPSLVGLATLVGIVVNDSILLVSTIQRQSSVGVVMRQAVETAVEERFRAVMITSITTIVGLLPLLLESSTQAQFMIPLVTSLAFGLLSATLLSLFLIPACFVMIDELQPNTTKRMQEASVSDQKMVLPSSTK